MRPKIYQVLKFFALLVFSLEVLAPAFLANAPVSKNDIAKHFVNASTNTQSQLLCMFSEELASEEDGEDGEGHKAFHSFFSFELVSSFYFQVQKSASVSIHVFESINTLSRQPLYLLHRLFLI